MAEIVGDCPRCGSQSITFDIDYITLVGEEYGWQKIWEAFAVCRRCLKSTVFVIKLSTGAPGNIDYRGQELLSLPGSLNHFVDIDRYISVRDVVTRLPPDHLPPDVEAAYREGTACLAIKCFNAAGAMFRLSVDLATQPLLPDENIDGLNDRIRRSLGLRLNWLFETGYLPEALKGLSVAVREEGNDGAHTGSLTEADAEDLLDFAEALLTRMFTEPERLRLAQERRNARRGVENPENDEVGNDASVEA